MDELRDRIAEAIYDKLNGKYGDFCMPKDAAQAVIDALGLHQLEGAAKPSEEIRKAKAEAWESCAAVVEDIIIDITGDIEPYERQLCNPYREESHE